MSEIEHKEYVNLLKSKIELLESKEERAFKDGVEQGVRSVLRSIICNFLYRYDEGIDYHPLQRALSAEEFLLEFHRVFKVLERENDVVWDEKKNGYVLSLSMRELMRDESRCGLCGKSEMDMMLAKEPFSLAGNRKYPKYSENKGKK